MYCTRTHACMHACMPVLITSANQCGCAELFRLLAWLGGAWRLGRGSYYDTTIQPLDYTTGETVARHVREASALLRALLCLLRQGLICHDTRCGRFFTSHTLHHITLRYCSVAFATKAATPTGGASPLIERNSRLLLRYIYTTILLYYHTTLRLYYWRNFSLEFFQYPKQRTVGRHVAAD